MKYIKNKSNINGFYNNIHLALFSICIVLSLNIQAQLFGGGLISSRKIVIPSNISLSQNQRYFVASIYDQNYLPYSNPTGPASTAVVNPDGSNEASTVNVQGSITTTGITISIPVTATGSGTLPAYNTTTSVAAALTEDGIAREVTLSWAEQAYTTSTTAISATLRAEGGNLNAKKLDINAGIGNDYLGILLAELSYPINNTGATSIFQARVIAGIPDRMFGVADNNGNTNTHRFIYIPVVAEDGKVWLNNNLGADYANINSVHFNPGMQATSTSDFRAYGSLFQWGRKPDGHELITWTASSSGSSTYGSTTTRSNNPTHSLFINATTIPNDWATSLNTSLWASESSANNPCPPGFRLPTQSEFQNLYSSGSGTHTARVLKLSFAGSRQHWNGTFSGAASFGYYHLAGPSMSRYRYHPSACGNAHVTNVAEVSSTSGFGIHNADVNKTCIGGEGSTIEPNAQARSVRCIRN